MSVFLRSAILILTLSAASAVPARTQSTTADDPLTRLKVLAGEWRGEAQGESGQGTARRTYEFVLNGRYLYERNVTTYPPQEKNPKGEVHEHWTIFSYDRARKMLVMRQFHQEGFVNQYAMPAAGKEDSFVVESEAFENVPAGWKARERYEVISRDEIIETFEISLPGQPFATYSRTQLKRVK